MDFQSNSLAKWLILIGVMLISIGGLLLAFGKISGLPKLPGDILIKTDKVTFYFPIVTSIILSILLTLFFVLIKKLR